MVNYRQDKETTSKKPKGNRPSQTEGAQAVRPNAVKVSGRKSNKDPNSDSNKGGLVLPNHNANENYVCRQEQQDSIEV